MGSWVYPVIKYKNPETTFDASTLSRLAALANVSPTAALDDLATTARDASNGVVTSLRTARTAAPTVVPRDVYFSIPRPGRTVSSPFRTIDTASAASIWKDLTANKDLNFTIRSDFIYRPGGGTFTLNCGQGVPTIKSVALAFWAPNATASIPSKDVPTRVTAEMQMPTAQTNENIVFTNSLYLAPTVRIYTWGGSTTEDAFLATLDSYLGANPVAAGLSPLTTVHVDLSSMRTDFVTGQRPYDLADELIVAFKVEPRDLGAGVVAPGVKGCGQ